MPLRVSCRGPRLAHLARGGAGPASSSPCLAWGRAPPCRQACFCVLALRAVGAARGRAGGGPLAWVWDVRFGALSHARPSVLCVRGRLPTGCGCGGWEPADPPPTPQRALLRAGFARCGGGTTAPGGGGGRLVPGCGASAVGRSPTPDRPSFGACGRGPLPTGCGCGGCGRGDPSPTPRRALLRAGFARCGGGRRVPGGGAPLAWVCGVRGWALIRARPPVLWGVRPGPTTDWLWVRGVRAWGPVTNPTTRTLASWLCALWGRHEGAQGGRLVPGCGASGLGRSPYPDRPSFGACSRGSLPTGCGCGGCGRGDLSPTPRRALLRAGFASCGGGTRALGGGTWCLGVGRPGSGALPPWSARAFGRAAGAHYQLAVGAGGAGVGTRHQPHSAHS